MHDPTEMPERLARFLSHVEDRHATVHAYEPMVGGYSRVMARAEISWSDGSRETIVLRGDPPPGKSMMETDRDLEHALLRIIEELGAVRLARARHYDATGEHLGTKCIVLDHVEGPSMQAALDVRPDGDHGPHRDLLVDLAADVHGVEPSDVAGVLAAPDDWDHYLDGLIDRFRQAELAHVEPDPFLTYTAAWLQEHKPPPLPLRLVHGDFQPANVVLDADGTTHLVDWELAHVGDPREDLGWYNVYSMSSGPNMYLPDPEGFLARYRARTGFDERAVNPATIAYFTSLAAITVFAQVLGGAGAMARGDNAGLMTTYTINALTVGHGNFLAGCS